MDRPYGDPGGTVSEVRTLDSCWFVVFSAHLKSLYACAPTILQGKGHHETSWPWAHV